MASTLKERNQEVADSAEELFNTGKEQLELTIEQARKDIEALLNKKVYLDLFVKVIPKWRDKDQYLSEFGFEDFKENE